MHTCTHIFPNPPFSISEVPVSLCGGGGVLHFHPHFPEVNFLCVWGGGAALLLFETEGGVTIPRVPHFPPVSTFFHFPLVATRRKA